MNTEGAIRWLKSTFRKDFEKILEGTPYSIDLLVAIAYQETGYLWGSQIGKLKIPEILEICVGDTLDIPNRADDAFPNNKSDLLSVTDGAKMFRVAREALELVAKYDKSYAGIVKKNANKFCHGYGLFQYDLQFFQKDREFFLEKKWSDFGECLKRFIDELRAAQKRQKWGSKTTLTDTEQVYIAIAYNAGSANPSKGFKQGHFNKDEGRYYGEKIDEFFRISQRAPMVEGDAGAPLVAEHEAPLPPPTQIEVTDDIFMVEVNETALRLRSEPRIVKSDPNSNVIARLPDSQLVHLISGKRSDEFLEVETSLNGAYFRGFAASKHLIPVKKATAVEVVTPAPVDATPRVPEVHMPRKSGSVTVRTQPAGAHSLNEKDQPGREGQTAAERVTDLAEIINWLAVDKVSHKRYQPTSTATFCNIYTHDYCSLAGVYLPRVWWLPGALLRLGKGEKVEPQYEKTIDEMRANDLFRWFRDFGPDFGWRQTGTLTKIQDAANLGGIGIIVARRKIEGRSGHIVAVVPETEDERARRDSGGNVIAPLQSQAGSRNFRYGTGTVDWWKGDQFADSAFWIHA
jgi:hypothetical protein